MDQPVKDRHTYGHQKTLISLHNSSRKIVYLYIGIIFTVLAYAAVTYDFIVSTAYLGGLRPSTINTNLNIGLACVHSISFLSSILSFIYSSEMDLKGPRNMALATAVASLVSYALRVAYELLFINYSPKRFTRD